MKTNQRIAHMDENQSETDHMDKINQRTRNVEKSIKEHSIWMKINPSMHRDMRMIYT